MLVETLLLPAALGSLVGLIMALTGAGGGVLAVPLLIFGLHLSVQQAAPVALIAVGSAAALGAILGLREGVVRYRAAALIGLMAMAVAPLGVWLAHQLPPRPLMLGFAGVLLFSAWRMTQLKDHSRVDTRPPPPCLVDPAQGRLRWTPPCAAMLALTGLLSGLLTGLLGVGGGFVIVPALSRYSDLDLRSITATSLAVIALASLSGVLAASGHGSVDGSLALRFGAAAMLALLLGRRLARRLPPAALRLGFAGVAAAVALLMLTRALGWISNAG
jgi:uncharacterized membrane protein YfcA